MVNYEQLGIECINLAKEIDTESVVEYIREKSMVEISRNKVDKLLNIKKQKSKRDTSKDVDIRKFLSKFG
ncbi:hypothetical protein Mefer_1166 [Methanocaldococcus fervens AG86]|uniref:Uncharacterized protein n=1 Tax=Methanocaldococcus fervens (strain DSM 4213 / JCM 15782 / AG86) TaxID=573064 RepID=C7P8U3_METFA|nr:hypothetical protein Mefer_1166 [Methanocaldococcus fervens AG86]